MSCLASQDGKLWICETSIHFVSFMSLFLLRVMQSLTSLKKLNLDDNQLTRVPALPPSLEELKMNSNKLSALTLHCFTGGTSRLSAHMEEEQHLWLK